MKARWLWASWALSVLVGLVAMEVLYILFGVVYLVPKFEKLKAEGIFDGPAGESADRFISWAWSFLTGVGEASRHVTWYLLAFLLGWGLFEWRVRSENKSLMRVSAFGTLAVALMIVVMFMFAALAIPFMLAVPGIIRHPQEPVIREQLASVRDSMPVLEKAIWAEDWQAMELEATRASRAMDRVANMGAAAPTILALDNQGKVDDLRTRLKEASSALREIEQAIRAKDVSRAKAGLKKLQQTKLPGTLDHMHLSNANANR